MPAAVETAVYSNVPAWHKLGQVLDSNGEKGLTIEQALPASGLDWEVRKVPIYAYEGYQEDGTPIGNPILIQDRFGVQRSTDGRVFGTVGKTWEPVQNIEGFRLVDDLLQIAGGEGTKCWVESAMALNDGKKVVVMVHLDSDLQIAGEQYADYLTFVNGHDGRTSVTAMSNITRIVCANTLEMATDEAEETGRVVRVRHTVNATDRIKEAVQILGMRNRRAEELARQGEWLVEQSISDAEFAGFLESLMPIKEADTPAATMIQDRRTDVANLYFDAQTNAPLKGTRWGAYQAVIEYADHGRRFQDDETQAKAQLGMTSVPIKVAAHRILQDKKLRPLATA